MSGNLIKKINIFIKEKTLIPENSTIIIGLSGGPDSVFLLQVLAHLRAEKNLTLIAAHLDHGWRAESKNDVQFCNDRAASYNVPIIVKTLNNLNLEIKFNGSKEEIGRKARRAFFESLAKEYNASAIALAHHADDQMETFFIRMVRGTSLAGLAGMKAKEGMYIRPLLEIKKAEILHYLHENNIRYVIDESNNSDAYLRNRIRNTVIPALQKADDRFEQNFTALHANLTQTEQLLQELAAKTLVQISDEEGSLSIEPLLSLHPVLCNRVLINWLITNKVPFTPSQSLLDEIMRFFKQPGNGKHIFYGKWCIKKNSGYACIIFFSKNLKMATGLSTHNDRPVTQKRK